MSSTILRATRFAIVFAIAALLVSCSFTRFGYNQADTVAAWMANDYLDLTGSQKEDFDKRFERFYAWHRYEQLPDYAAFMRTARGRVQQGSMSREDVLWFMDGVKGRVRTAARRASPEVATFLATVTPAQIENLQRKWEKDNKKYLKEHKVNGTLDERQHAEAERITKQFKNWLTGLNSEQEQRVLAMVRELPDLEQMRYAERLRRQKEFIAILQQRNEGEAFKTRITEWLVNWERGRSADEQKRLDAWWAKRADIFVGIERMLTPDQRTTSLQRLASLADDFTQLARRPDANRTAAR